MQLDQFSSYSEQLENYLKKETSNIKESFDNRVKALSIEDDDEATQLYEMQYEDVHHSFKNEYPIILRTSLFLSIYTFLEKTLNNLCKKYEKDFKVKLNDIRHHGITKSKFYLSNVCNIDFPTSDWSLIQNYNIIRNHLAHEGYSLSIPKSIIRKPNKNEQRLKNAVKNIGGLELVDKGGFYQVDFDESFCDVFLRIVYKFISNLSESIKN